MGCTQSKIENEEAVSRCKERKQFMKESVTSRNAFAAAHSSYAIYLKNTGAAFSDYAQGEIVAPHPAHQPLASVVAPAAVSVPAPQHDHRQVADLGLLIWVMASKRILKELKDLQKDPPTSCSAGKFTKSKGIDVFGNDVKDTNIPVEVW